MRFDHHGRTEPCMYDTSTTSHHNGLMPTLEILEKVYRDPAYPPNTPVMPASLYNQGISRADLWAFATISAVEFGIDMNNIMCDDPTHLSALDTYNYPYDSGTSSSHYHYNIHYGESDCKVLKWASFKLIFHMAYTSPCRSPHKSSSSPQGAAIVSLPLHPQVCHHTTRTARRMPQTTRAMEKPLYSTSRIISV